MMRSISILQGTAKIELVKVGTGSLVFPQGQEFPEITLQVTGGTKWTFTKVTFKDLVIPSAQPQANGRPVPIETISFNYATMTGPPTGFQDPSMR